MYLYAEWQIMVIVMGWTVSPQIDKFMSQSSVPSTVTIFGDMAFKDVS